MADQDNQKGDTVEELNKQLLMYKQDPMYALFFSIVRKSNEVAESLNSFTLNLQSEGKDFERFNVLIKMLPDLTKTLDTLRREYLKIDEEEAKELEKKGIPLIEQSIPKQKSPASRANQKVKKLLSVG